MKNNLRFYYRNYNIFENYKRSNVRYGFNNVYKAGNIFFFGYQRIPIRFLRPKTFALKKWYKFVRSRRKLAIVAGFGVSYVVGWVPLFAIHRRGRGNSLLATIGFGVCIGLTHNRFIIRNKIGGENLDYSISFFCPILKHIRKVLMPGLKYTRAKIYFVNSLAYNRAIT